jgi:hypothetical protein
MVVVATVSVRLPAVPGFPGFILTPRVGADHAQASAQVGEKAVWLH